MAMANPSAEQMEVIERMCTNAAESLSRRTGYPHQEDAAQDARIRILNNLDKYHAHKGGFETWCWVTAAREVRRHIWSNHYPVVHKHRPERLRGIGVVHIDKSTNTQDDADTRASRILSDYATPEHRLEHAQLRWRVRNVIAKLFGESGVAFAVGVVSGEHTPQEIADAHGRDVESIYRKSEYVRRKLRSSPELEKLYKESA